MTASIAQWSRRRLRAVRAALAAVVLLGAVVTVAHPAQGYALNGCRQPSPGVRYGNFSTYPRYYLPGQASAAAWTATPTPVYFVQADENISGYIDDIGFGQNWADGLSRMGGGAWGYTNCPGGVISGWAAAWNIYYASAPDYTAAKLQSVMVHELGHILGLGHFSYASCVNKPIMEPDPRLRFNTCGLTTPRQDDINGINYIY